MDTVRLDCTPISWYQSRTRDEIAAVDRCPCGQPRLHGSYFAASGYWALNFNDFLSGPAVCHTKLRTSAELSVCMASKSILDFGRGNEEALHGKLP